MTIEAMNRIHALPEVLNAFNFIDANYGLIDRGWAEMVYDAFEHSMTPPVSINYLLIRCTGKPDDYKIIEITSDGYYAFRAPLKEELA